ncbi:hypothetical protein ACWF95_34005 [Streptomyces vinaceus]
MAGEAGLATQVLALASAVAKLDVQVKAEGTRGKELQDVVAGLIPLQDALDHLEDRTAGLQAGMEAIEPLREALAAMTGQVAQLRQDLAALAADPAEEPLLVWNWAWTGMDQEQAREAWGTLVPWVHNVLAGQYGWVGLSDPTSVTMTRIPPCWYRHREAVLELSWLCQEWNRIYTTSYGTPSKAGDWHDRYAPGVRRRLMLALEKCASGHQDDQRELYTGFDKQEQLSAWQDWDLKQREAAPAPGPTAASI